MAICASCAPTSGSPSEHVARTCPHHESSRWSRNRMLSGVGIQILVRCSMLSVERDRLPGEFSRFPLLGQPIIRTVIPLTVEADHGRHVPAGTRLHRYVGRSPAPPRYLGAEWKSHPLNH